MRILSPCNEPWSVKHRVHLVRTQVIRDPYRAFGLKGVAAAVLHAIKSPSKGCSCSFCFYSKRRKFPPGHPLHHVQVELRTRALVEHEVGALAEAVARRIRIRDESRPHPLDPRR